MTEKHLSRITVVVYTNLGKFVKGGIKVNHALWRTEIDE